MEILDNYEVRRFIKASVTVICTGLIAVYGNDPRYMAFIPIVDRARAYIFRKLNLD